MRKGYTGFGYHPQESQSYFDVVIGAGPNAIVSIYECFPIAIPRVEPKPQDILRLALTKERWDKLASTVTEEFNRRLRAGKKPAGRFTAGHNPVEKSTGKELMVLLWGTEHEEPEAFPTALCNWLGLLPEERQWLYTMTDVSTGSPGDRGGWRTALRYILCENPVG